MDLSRNEKQLIYYHTFKKQLKYYYENKDKRLAYMKEYRLKQKLGTTSIKNKNVSIQRGLFILNFD